MGRYRKKPIEIEAIQFTGTNKQEIEQFVGKVLDFEVASRSALQMGLPTDITSIFINTLEGRMEASVGDYIIKGVQGEFYPCKPDIFGATYEEV